MTKIKSLLLVVSLLMLFVKGEAFAENPSSFVDANSVKAFMSRHPKFKSGNITAELAWEEKEGYTITINGSHKERLQTFERELNGAWFNNRVAQFFIQGLDRWVNLMVVLNYPNTPYIYLEPFLAREDSQYILLAGGRPTYEKAWIKYYIGTNGIEFSPGYKDKPTPTHYTLIGYGKENTSYNQEQIQAEPTAQDVIASNGLTLFDLKGNVKTMSWKGEEFATPILSIINSIFYDGRNEVSFAKSGIWNATKGIRRIGDSEAVTTTLSSYPNGYPMKFIIDTSVKCPHEISFKWNNEKLAKITHNGYGGNSLFQFFYEGDRLIEVTEKTESWGSEYVSQFQLIDETIDEHGNWIKRTWKASYRDELIIETRTITYW